MRTPVALSVLVHVAVALFAIFGLPRPERTIVLPPTAIPIDVVDIGELTTRVTEARPEPPRPQPAPRPAQSPPRPPEPRAAEPPPPPAVAERPPEPPRIDEPPARREPAPPARREPPAPAEPVPAPVERPEPPPEPEPEPRVASAPQPRPKPTPPKPEPEQPRPRPEPPKPEEPKQEPQRREEPNRFDSVLKSLEKLREQEAPSEPAQQQPEPETQPTRQSQLAQLSDRLTLSEEDALRRQIGSCWNVPAGARDAQDLIVDIFIEVNPDRTVRNARIVDQARMRSDSFFRSAAESALRAVLNPRCSPLQLPADKYEQWRTIRMSFNPKDMFGT